MEEYAREPCPFRIVDDCGGAFAMGCIGGGIFQAIKGFRNAPSGMNKRLFFMTGSPDYFLNNTSYLNNINLKIQILWSLVKLIL
ncbi:mitochondrial import inner membrane translocase subunit Tim17-A-like isoform X1 [Lucilia cuprina]|uniref:mitochondrial import inner membrane translocase subunit Tim17-A-like isoform X1 n=1 Tax=Lucilia cuprina TaxID=7375 RepID=UPI001F065504|nr:mitochondrial import inner membrane translocase subunit Tim17-A-like isoform X1 [Lucilia cuprina]